MQKGRTLGGKGCQQQRRPAAQIGGRNLGTVQLCAALHLQPSALLTANRAHGGKTGGTGKAAGKQGVVNFTGRIRTQQHGSRQRGGVGGKGGPGVGTQGLCAVQRHGGVAAQGHGISAEENFNAAAL